MDSRAYQEHKKPPLSASIRNGTLLMLALTVVIGAFAVPATHKLGGSIREALHRNYLSIEAAQQMHTALYAAELNQLQGHAPALLDQSRAAFTRSINVELNDITEIGEGSLARDIATRGQHIFGELSHNRLPGTPSHAEFAVLHQRLDDLIQMNQAAMFRADGRAMRMGDGLASEFAVALVVLLLIGIVISWTLGRNVSRPLTELSEHLRSFSLRGPSVRLGLQPFAELQAVASEFNRLADRLERFEKLNVERLIYEQGKTEATLESIEDGIVLIDSDGIVTHINEVAGIILGVEREEAFGSPFDDLSSNHPHYLRVRSALQRTAKEPLEAQRIEVALHVRGRDHIYILKSVPLRQDGRSFGTILILQDITYLRSREQARTNLVATLSHELKSPLASLALSAQLLERSSSLNHDHRELVNAITEDVGRLKNLSNELLDLARGTAGTITLNTAPVDVRSLLEAVIRSFTLQAEQKGIVLTTECDEPIPQFRADSIKMSWVVSNLLANALRCTPPDGAITLSATSTARAIRLQVRDTGAGIAPEVQHRVFERFAQGHVNGAAAGSASLGLAIAKEIVQAHGGRIFVDSMVGKGTCFTVELPIDEEFSGKAADC
jgi:two-component system, NtrC family, sensor histidine kinase KinB